MKKFAALLLALALMASFAACNSKKETNTNTPSAQTPGETTGGETEQLPNESTGETVLSPEDILGESQDASNPDEENLPTDPEGTQPGLDTTTAVDILQDVWGRIDDSKKPSIIGGHFSDPSDQPASYDLGYAADLQSVLIIPDVQITYVTDAATAVHMLNANTMTIGIVRLTDGTDMQAFAEVMRDSIRNHQWSCGIPESMYIARVHGNFMVIAYGAADILDNFAQPLAAGWDVYEYFKEAL